MTMSSRHHSPHERAKWVINANMGGGSISHYLSYMNHDTEYLYK